MNTDLISLSSSSNNQQLAHTTMQSKIPTKEYAIAITPNSYMYLHNKINKMIKSKMLIKNRSMLAGVTGSFIL